MRPIKAIRQYFAGFKRQVPQRWFPINNLVTRSKVRVTAERAMQLSAVMACVRIIAETIATLPVHVYQRVGDARYKRPEHPLSELLLQPNEWQTWPEYLEMMIGHVCLRGNAFAHVTRQGGAAAYVPRALVPIHPDRVQVERVGQTGELRYIITDPEGRSATFPADNIHHLKGLSGDGVTGLSPIAFGAESMGIALAAEELSSSFFRNGAILGAALQHPGSLSTAAQRRLKESLVEDYSGPDAAYQVYVLEEGMTWQAIGVKPEEGQFLETRKFQTREIARLFRVPPHLIGDVERATFNNIEHQSIDFVMHTIRPWLVRIEAAMVRDFLPPGERAHYVKFLVEGLLRGDVIRRANALRIQFQHGALSQDEWREIEDRNPIPDGSGQRFFVPLNMVEGGGVGGESSEGDGKQPRSQVLAAWIESTIDRLVAAELRAVSRRLAASASGTPFDQWLINFYGKHAEYVLDALAPIMRCLGRSESLAPLAARITGEALTYYGGLEPIEVRQSIGNGRYRMIRDILTQGVEEIKDAFR